MSSACCTSSTSCQDESSSYTCPHHGSTAGQPPPSHPPPSLDEAISNPLYVPGSIGTSHVNAGSSPNTVDIRITPSSVAGRRQSRPPPLALLRRDDCFIDPCLELPQFAVGADPTLSTLPVVGTSTGTPLPSPLPPRVNDDEDSGGSLTWQDDHEPLSSPALPSNNRRQKHVFFSISDDSLDMPPATLHERDVELGEATLRLHQTNVVQGGSSPRTSLTGITHATDNAKPPLSNATGSNLRQPDAAKRSRNRLFLLFSYRP